MTPQRRHRFWVNAAGLPLLALAVVPARAVMLAQLAPGMGPSALEYTLGGVVVLGGILWLLYSRLDKHLEHVRTEETKARESMRVALDHRLDQLRDALTAEAKENAGTLGEIAAEIRGLFASLSRLREDFNGIGSKLTNQLYSRYDPQMDAMDKRVERIEKRLDGVLALMGKDGAT